MLTRARLMGHCRRNNMGDVAAKDGSQETLVNLSALLASLIITPIVSDNFVSHFEDAFFNLSFNLMKADPHLVLIRPCGAMSHLLQLSSCAGSNNEPVQFPKSSTRSLCLQRQWASLRTPRDKSCRASFHW